jgi:transposase-like protein
VTGPGAIKRVADQLGVHPEALRTWVRQAEIDDGARPGTTSDDASRLAELERENRELRRANEILRTASAFLGSPAHLVGRVLPGRGGRWPPRARSARAMRAWGLRKP